MYCVCCDPCTAPCTASSTDMSDADWDQYILEAYNSAYGTSYSYTATSVDDAADGNPAHCRKFDFSGSTTAACISFWLMQAELLTGFTWDPATDGEISSVTTRMNQKKSGITNPTLVAILRQSGTYYVYNSIFNQSSDWNSASFTCKTGTESSYIKYLGTDSAPYAASGTCGSFTIYDASSHPDFSSSGDLIEFGYGVVAVVGNAVVPDSLTATNRADNYCLVIR